MGLLSFKGVPTADTLFYEKARDSRAKRRARCRRHSNGEPTARQTPGKFFITHTTTRRTRTRRRRRRPSASSLFRASPRRSNPSRARTARTATPSRVVLAPRVVRDVSIPIGGTNPKRTNVARRRLAASRRQRRRRASTGASQASRAVRLVKFIPPLFLLQIYSFNQH